MWGEAAIRAVTKHTVLEREGTWVCVGGAVIRAVTKHTVLEREGTCV